MQFKMTGFKGYLFKRKRTAPVTHQNVLEHAPPERLSVETHFAIDEGFLVKCATTRNSRWYARWHCTNLKFLNVVVEGIVYKVRRHFPKDRLNTRRIFN